MFTVILVDDESIIVEGLNQIIPWKDFQCEVVGKANDVKNAVALIEELKPDILFTDIRMPDGNGLSMLAGLRALHPNMQVTVLTGHDEFDYAQKAINLGVTRFLLKPSKMNELVEALSTMTNNLARYQQQTEPVSAENSTEGEYVNSFLVREAVEYIEANYSRKITLSDVADACYVSQWHLSKLLSKNAGFSFYDILNSTRINIAKELLENPALRIGEISTKVGYNDTPHFSRVFKKIEGMSPNEYRNLKL